MGHAEETLFAVQSSFLAICTVASLAHFSRLPRMFIFCGFSISPVLKDNHICNVQFSVFHENLCQILAVMSVHVRVVFTFILTICLGDGKALFFLKILFSFCCWSGSEARGGLRDLTQVAWESKQTEIPA